MTPLKKPQPGWLEVWKKATGKWPDYIFGFNPDKGTMSVSTKSLSKSIRRDIMPDSPKRVIGDMYLEMINELEGAADDKEHQGHSQNRANGRPARLGEALRGKARRAP